MTLILDAFDGPTVRLTLEDVARRTHLPRSTAHRILDQLVRLDWLHHSPFGYCLGSRSLNLGGGGKGNTAIREAAAGRLHDLAVRTGMVVHLAVLDSAEVYYLDKVGGRFAATVPSRVGGRAPAHCTALGKAMLAWLIAEDVDTMVGPAIHRATSRTIADLEMLHQELNRIRSRSGLAFERGECFPDIACVAAAVRGPDGPVASISLVGDSRTPLEKVAPLVVDAVRQVTAELFPDMSTPRAARQMAAVPSQETWSPRTLDRLMATENGDWL